MNFGVFEHKVSITAAYGMNTSFYYHVDLTNESEM